MFDEKFLNHLAYTLHMETWYKGTIEGKFGLDKDGADHGRFRASKNAAMDKEFFEKVEFSEDGYSLETEEHGFPLYKREVGEDGKVKYFVDSAILGWKFLPPSWKDDNLQAAKTLVGLMQHCKNDELNIGSYIQVVGSLIHKRWVARQVHGMDGSYTAQEAIILGRLSKEELDWIQDKGPEPVGETSGLYEHFGKDALKNVWGIENFVEFENLTKEEQIKDVMQMKYAVDLAAKTLGDEYFRKQAPSVSAAIERFSKTQTQN